jgi:Ca2+-binding EF-hand superfamily protein/diadenosine tetraphosphatase ApaH/serine/threonine PP2A family protein phosphatase
MNTGRVEGGAAAPKAGRASMKAALAAVALKGAKFESASLPGGGQFDDLLLPGRAKDLFAQLPAIFRDDKEVDCGRTHGRTAGLSGAREHYSEEVFSPRAVMELLRSAEKFWDPSPSGNIQRLVMRRPDDKLIIVGDTHGQLEDILWLFFKHGPPTATNQYLFNGDIVDRGGHALEILLLLFCFKRDCPDSVHINRGNHEDPQCCIHFGFRDELESKFQGHSGRIWTTLNSEVFPLLPICSLVSDEAAKRRFLVVHGGVPVDIPDRNAVVSLEDDLARLDRKKETLQGSAIEEDAEVRLLFHLLWADPVEKSAQKYRGKTMRGNRFCAEDTAEFCKHNDLSFIVRSHEVPRSLRGVEAGQDNQCYTVFSASDYTGSTGNFGGVVVTRDQLASLEVSEHWAPSWPVLHRIFRDYLSAAQEIHSIVISCWEGQFGGDGEADSGKGEFKDLDFEARLEEELAANGFKAEAAAAASGDVEYPIVENPPEEDQDQRQTGGIMSLPAIAGEILAFIKGGSVCSHPKNLCPGPLPLLHAPRLGKSSLSRVWRKSNALSQISQFTAERIVENKEQLFDSFRAADPDCTGILSRASWSRVLLETLGSECAQTLTLELMEELADGWGLLPDAPVKYVGFLHRFQIRGGDEKECGSQPVDLLKQVSRVREGMLDVSAQDVAKMLDPNRDQTVSKAEFADLLPRFGVEVPTFQAAALYETIVAQAGEHPLTVDSAILCLALVSKAPVPAGEWSEFAGELGEQVRSTGQSLPGIFRSWDQDGDGFLSVAELEAVLVKLPCEQAITHEQAATFAEYFDSVGLEDGQVSIFEFVRALAPRELALDLNRAMNKELLKLVWICRPALRTIMLCHDPCSTGKVDVERFREGLGQINGQLERLGHPVLSETQAKAVCEIASGGGGEVCYRCFLESLHVVDIDNEDQLDRKKSSGKTAMSAIIPGVAALGGA